MGQPAASEDTKSGAGSPASSPLATLLPGGRIRPGTAVSASGDMPLLLALAAESSRDTVGWAAVGLPQMGVLAAQAAGLDLAHGMRIDTPGQQWAQVLATVLEAVPVVMTGSLDPVPDRIARRLAAVMRRSGSVLLSAGGWQGADVRLQVVTSSWEGVGQGHGLLHARRVTVAAAGRGAAAAPRYAEMWLPGPGGAIAAMTGEDGAVSAVPAASAIRAAGGRAALRVVG